MKKLFYIAAPVTLALLVYGFMQAVYIAPTEATMGNIYRIFYYHVPAGILMDVFFFFNFAASIAYLALRRRAPLRAEKVDAFALANAEMGAVFCLVSLTTGPLWARPVWGIWWTWDERLTSTLVLFLIYSAYLMLRRFAVPGQMQTLAAVLAIFGFVDVPIVYMSIRWWRTQHPSPVLFGGPNSGLDPRMKLGLLWNVIAWLAWGLLLMSVRYFGLRREQAQDTARSQIALKSTLEAA